MRRVGIGIRRLVINETKINMCPRCGCRLARGKTPTGKVCSRCPSCGGVVVTLPALQESLGAKSIAVLAEAARATESGETSCPGCGGRMSLLRVADEVIRLEIDVCGHCLSVWCDNGEYESLVPSSLQPCEESTLHQLLTRASPEARERYAAAVLNSLPEDVSPDDFNVSDVLRDIARFIIGMPTLWRTVRPTSPVLANVLLISLPIVQGCVYSCFYDAQCAGEWQLYGRFRDFWMLTPTMAKSCGFDISLPITALTFPFVQFSGRMALLFAFLLFVPFIIIERRVGHIKFLALLAVFIAISVVTQMSVMAVGLSSGRLVGIVPVGLGYLAFANSALHDLRIKGSFGLLSVYSVIVLLVLVSSSWLYGMSRDFLSIGLCPSVVCAVIGALIGIHYRKHH